MDKELIYILIIKNVVAILIIYAAIKNWRFRKLPWYEFYEFVYIMPLTYPLSMYSLISSCNKRDIELPEAVAMWVCVAILTVTGTHVYIRKHRDKTFKNYIVKNKMQGAILVSVGLLICLTGLIILCIKEKAY